MYGLELIPRLFKEAEVAVMDEKDLEGIKRILNKKMCENIIEFLNKVEELDLASKSEPIAQAICSKIPLIKEILYDKARRYTFHLEVKDRGLSEFIFKLNLTIALNVIEDPDKMLEDLTWLLENKRYWTISLEPRTKEDFETFEGACYNIERKANMFKNTYSEAEVCHNVAEVIRENKAFFYVPRETKVFTNMSTMFSREDDIIELKNGLEYDRICRSLGMPIYLRRSM